MYNKSLSPNHVMMICTSYIRHIGDFTCVTLIIKPLLPLQTVLDEDGEFFLYPSYRMMCTFSTISERITSLSFLCTSSAGVMVNDVSVATLFVCELSAVKQTIDEWNLVGTVKKRDERL